jgi:hypothetical protein
MEITVSSPKRAGWPSFLCQCEAIVRLLDKIEIIQKTIEIWLHNCERKLSESKCSFLCQP